MRALLTLAILTVSTAGFAQTTGRTLPQSVTTRQGVTLRVGDDLRLGEGSLPSGWYKYIFTSISALDQQKGRLDDGYAYNHSTIREFREVGSGNNRRLIVLVRPKGGIHVYPKAVDIESAIGTKEVISVNGTAISKLIKAAANKGAKML